MGLYLAVHIITNLKIHVIVMFITFIGLIILVFVNIYKRFKAEYESKIAKKKLEESYMELGEAYQQVNITKNELAEKYEELKQSEAKNKKLAFTDFVTNLPNRTAFSEKLDYVLTNRLEHENIAVYYIDLDNFKNINDILGHSYGDALLAEVAGRLKDIFNKNDYIARFGGDEFVVLSRMVSKKESCEEKIEWVHQSFIKPFILSTREFFVTMSIGIVYNPSVNDNSQTIMKNADAAMYEAKSLGKNSHYFYEDSLNYNLLCKIELQSELRKAILNHEFLVYYQAQIDLKKEKIIGFEALIRWNNPIRGLVSPNEFVQAAEETGQIVEIGEWVLYEACKQLKEWNNKGFQNINIAVNLSARQFKDMNLVNMVKDAVISSGINPENLELEITESIALENIDYSIEVIQELKKMGIRFSLDDFGTGYSSMNYLKTLPVNTLKIDKSFLDTVFDNNSDQKIVSGIITLAQTLDLVVIAEGVESAEQAVFLRNANCDQAQGYLYSKPVPPDQACRFLEKVENHKRNTKIELIKE